MSEQYPAALGRIANPAQLIRDNLETQGAPIGKVSPATLTTLIETVASQAGHMTLPAATQLVLDALDQLSPAESSRGT